MTSLPVSSDPTVVDHQTVAPVPMARWHALAADRFARTERNFHVLSGDVTTVVAAARLLYDAIRSGGKIMLCGNGGSAADAQHLAAELMGRFQRDRRALPAIALTTDTSTLTAISNDYGYDQVFARQVAGIGAPGDALVGISTSGQSRNVALALAAARDAGIGTVALTGADVGALGLHADVAVRAPATGAARVQELHIAIGHTICELLEEALT